MTRTKWTSPGVRSIAERLDEERLTALRDRVGVEPDRPLLPEEGRRLAIERAEFRDADATPDPERIVIRLQRSRVMPAALAMQCAEHGADAGEACFGTIGEPGAGACAARVRRGIRGGAI